MQIRAKHCRDGIDNSDRVVLGQRPDLRVRTQLGGPENLTSENIADAPHHALIEEYLGETNIGLGMCE